MAESAFKLKSMADMFKPTDDIMARDGNNSASGAGNGHTADDSIGTTAIIDNSNTIHHLPLDKLHPFKNHPFHLYEGQRFDDMVESIKSNGVHVPIIVRPVVNRIGLSHTMGDDIGMGADGGTYEILSGHNRVEASKTAGLTTIPAIVRKGLTDDEALLIVTETNLLQRSFPDLTHSERAVTLFMHHEATKKQGRRTDLITEIENMLKAAPGADCGTCSPVENKSKSMAIIGTEYGLGKESVARYLRIHKLIAPHKKRVDNGEIAIRAAVSLSYLSANEQQMVDDILDSSHYRLDMKKAESLRILSERRPLNHEDVEQILKGTKKPRAAKPAAVKLKPKLIAKYFTPDQKPDEIEATIADALAFYYAHRAEVDTGAERSVHADPQIE